MHDDYSDYASFDDEQEQIMDIGMIRILHAGSSIAGTLIGVAMLTPLYATIGTLAWLEAASSRATRRSS